MIQCALKIKKSIQSKIQKIFEILDITIRNIGILKNIAISCKDRDDDIWIEDNSGLAMNRILKEKVDLWKNGY